MDKSMNVLIKLIIAEKVIGALGFIIWFLIKAVNYGVEKREDRDENDTDEIEIRQRIIIE